MTHNRVLLTVLTGLLIGAGCNQEPEPIQYGESACNYCRMSIVDERYAAQLMSTTGKTFQFDALECLIHYKHEHPEVQWQIERATDYRHPRQLIDVREAVILRSGKLPSPMGLYLTTVSDSAAAKALQEEHGGRIYTYGQVEQNIDELPGL